MKTLNVCVLLTIFFQISLQNPINMEDEVTHKVDKDKIIDDKLFNAQIQSNTAFDDSKSFPYPPSIQDEVAAQNVAKENLDLNSDYLGKRIKRGIKKFFKKLGKSAEKRFKEAWPAIISSAVKG